MGSHNTRVGADGEQVAVRYLEQNGFTIFDTNYAARTGGRLLGEIDIVAKCDNVVHMCEVKTAPRRYRSDVDPADRVNYEKLQHLARAGEIWVNDTGYTGNWQIDVIVVYINADKGTADIRHLRDVASGAR